MEISPKYPAYPFIYNELAGSGRYQLVRLVDSELERFNQKFDFYSNFRNFYFSESRAAIAFAAVAAIPAAVEMVGEIGLATSPQA